MKIMLVNNESQDFSGRSVSWEGHTVGFTGVGFEDVVSGLGRSDADPAIDKGKLDRLANETRNADAVYCESPEALLLWYVLSRRDEHVPPFVIEDEDSLWRVSKLAAWIKKVYHEDVLKDFITDRSNVWLYHAASHRERFTSTGLHDDRLFYLPCSSYLLSIVSPETFARLADFAPRTADSDILEMKGAVVCPGANRRDYATFAAAANGISSDAWIFGHRGDPIPGTDHVRWKGFVPLDDFLDGLSMASVIVVPMLDDTLSGGENTLTFSMALGKPVVATDTASTRELITNSESGILTPAGDSDAIRAAVTSLLNEPDRATTMGAKAREREREIAAVTREALLRAFDIVGTT